MDFCVINHNYIKFEFFCLASHAMQLKHTNGEKKIKLESKIDYIYHFVDYIYGLWPF